MVEPSKFCYNRGRSEGFRIRGVSLFAVGYRSKGALSLPSIKKSAKALREYFRAKSIICKFDQARMIDL